MSYWNNTDKQYGGRKYEQEFLDFLKSKGVQAKKSTISQDKVLHADIIANIGGKEVYIDVKGNKWFKGFGAFELSVPKSFEGKYRQCCGHTVQKGAYNSSWSDKHTDHTEWIVFKINNEWMYIDKDNCEGLTLTDWLKDKVRKAGLYFKNVNNRWSSWKEDSYKQSWRLYPNQGDSVAQSKICFLVATTLDDVKPILHPLLT